MFNWKSVILGCVIILPLVGYGDTAPVNESLVQIIYQLDAVLPLIDTAEQEQANNSREQFHFETFTDVNGVTHPGLREDILAIRQGIIDALDQPAVEPRTFAPLTNDFIDNSYG